MRAWMILPLLMAGCIGPDGAPLAHPSDAEAASSISWTGCEQWHLHFQARAEDLAQDVPPGFEVAADELGLTTFLIHVTLCGDLQEAVLAIPVVAPPEHEDPDRVELAVVEVFHAGHAGSVYPRPFAERLVEATFARSDTGAGPVLTIDGGGETTTLALTLGPGSGTFDAEHWVRFAGDTDSLGVVAVDGSDATNVGAGTVAYAHEGPGGAPPLTGGIAHVVTDLDLALSSEVRA